MLLMMRNRPGLPLVRRRRPVPAGHAGQHLQLVVARGDPVPRRPRRGRVAIVEDDSFLERILKVRKSCPPREASTSIEPPRVRCPTVCSRRASCSGTVRADLDALAAATEPDDIATLIYTSGTTGPPKGVMISQYNVVYTIEILKRSIDFDDFARLRVVSYLPMAHIAERAVSHYQSMISATTSTAAPTRTSSRPTSRRSTRSSRSAYRGCGRRSTTVSTPRSRPTPSARRSSTTASTRRSRSEAEPRRHFTDEQQGDARLPRQRAFANVRALVGLDALEFAITGAAPIPAQVLEWFNAIGVPLAEIYGMSETTGPMTFSPERPRSAPSVAAVTAWR
jgi:long-chain acyl-CoA synthetase